MKYINDWQMDELEHRYRHHPVLRPATLTLRSLEQGVNACSDGWPYWRAPRRAAQQLMELIEPAGMDPRALRFETERPDATPAKLQRAYTQLRRFRTTHPACEFRIYPADGVTNADPKAEKIEPPVQYQIRLRVIGDKAEVTVTGDSPLPPGRYTGTVVKTGEVSAA